MIDMGKHRLLYSDERLRQMRTWIHVVMGLLNFGIILYFLTTFFMSLGDDSESDHKSVAILYFFVAALICIVNIL